MKDNSPSSQDAAADRTPIRLLVADNHAIVRHGITALMLRKPGLTVVAEASNGQEAVEMFRLHRPDVTLMDLRMPVLDGAGAAEMIRDEFPQARIILLTIYDTDEDVYRGVKCGAAGYLLKESHPNVLVEAIRAVHAGRKSIPLEIAHRAVERMQMPDLTVREHEVLTQIVTGLSNKEIAAALTISEGTVRAHLNNMYTKMKVSDRTQAAIQAFQRGLMLLERSST